MRRDVQEIFKSTPHEKQVMMFSATLSKDIRPVCKKFMQDVSIETFPTYLKTSNVAAPIQACSRQSTAHHFTCNSLLLSLWQFTECQFAKT